MENKSDSQPKRDVGLVGKCCGPLARTWAVEAARVCHPWEDASVTAAAGSQVSAETTCPEGEKWDLEQGRGGGVQRVAVQLDGQSQQPERSRAMWLQGFQSMAALSRLSTLTEMEAQQSKSEMPLGPSSTARICSYLPSIFFTWLCKPIKTVFTKSIQKNIRWSEIIKQSTDSIKSKKCL